MGGVGQREGSACGNQVLNRLGALDEARFASLAENVENGGLDPLGKFLDELVLKKRLGALEDGRRLGSREEVACLHSVFECSRDSLLEHGSSSRSRSAHQLQKAFGRSLVVDAFVRLHDRSEWIIVCVFLLVR